MYPGKKSVEGGINENWRCLRRDGLTPNERGQETVDEEAFTADTSTTAHTCVLGGVQGVEESAVDEIGRPDHAGRCDEEAAGDTSNRKADELC